MLYDSYVNRIKKVKVIRNFIIKYKLPIIILLAVIVLTISALVGTRGIVTDVELSSEGQEIVLNDDGSAVVERGTAISGKAKALNSDTYMELCINGEWIEFSNVDWDSLPVGDSEV